MAGIKRIMYLTIGFVSLALGAIGTIFPVLPTTPFLLLASYCLARGSKKFNDWFISTKLYKNHLESFINNRSMTLKQKICILVFADTMIAIPLIIVDSLIVKGILIAVILIKLYYFIFKIKTIKVCEIKE